MAGPSRVTIRLVYDHLPAVTVAERAAARAEVERHAFMLEARAKALAPVRTGLLRRSIHTIFSNGGLTAIIGPSVFYAIFVEFGTRLMGARPYMRPAAEYVWVRFVPALSTAIKNAGRAA